MTTQPGHFRHIEVTGSEGHRVAAATAMAERLEPGCEVVAVEYSHLSPDNHPVFEVKIAGPDPLAEGRDE